MIEKYILFDIVNDNVYLARKSKQVEYTIYDPTDLDFIQQYTEDGFTKKNLIHCSVSLVMDTDKHREPFKNFASLQVWLKQNRKNLNLSKSTKKLQKVIASL